MKHLLRILEIRHLDKNKKVIWEQYNVPNMIHAGGELYCLTALFNSFTTSLPTNYYIGLDNRTTLAREDAFENLSQEPTQFGYARQPVSSSTGFVVGLNTDDIYQATSGVITYNASGGTWGPIRNLFLATTLNNDGYLISSAALDGQHYLGDGEQLTMRLALTLRDFE